MDNIASLEVKIMCIGRVNVVLTLLDNVMLTGN